MKLFKWCLEKPLLPCQPLIHEWDTSANEARGISVILSYSIPLTNNVSRREAVVGWLAKRVSIMCVVCSVT